jgi:hypothetical protein
MKRLPVMLSSTILVLSGFVLAACAGGKEGGTATSTASPQLQSSPTATPTPSPTPVVEPLEFRSFRTFAEQIDRALRERDSQFFVDRAVVSEVRCGGDEQQGMCVDQPAGTTFRGVWSVGAHSGYIKIVSLEDYQEHLLSYLDAASPLQADELGGGDVALYGLASSPIGRRSIFVSEGQRAFYAITSAIFAPGSGYTREVRAFVFSGDHSDWHFAGELLVRFGPDAMEIYRAWLSGGPTWYYDYWEPWTTATP